MAKRPGFKKFKKSVSSDIETLRDEFAKMREQLDATRRQLDGMALANDKVVTDLRLVDERLAHMGREFSNQLHELANGIDGLEKHADSVSAEAITELHRAQARLAAEQVRYEISFRQDLADIADHLRRAR